MRFIQFKSWTNVDNNISKILKALPLFIVRCTTKDKTSYDFAEQNKK